ncbi:iron-containing alcohol dehydrogenase [Lachnospiraceae bacterium 62-35]
MLDFVTNRRVILGEGAIKEIPSVLDWYGKGKVFLCVFDRNAGCVKDIEADLKAAGKEYIIYDKVIGEPDLEVIDEGAALCISENCDAVVAVGGGSVIDTSKTISMIASNGGKTEEYQLEGREVVKIPLLFIAAATTAGTGAEVTKVSVVYNRQKGFKKAIYHNSMIADVAILDPAATVNLPTAVTVSTGMDAITHAIESYISNNANTISRMYSLKALELLADNIRIAYNEPGNMKAREHMLLGSYFAGCAISAGTCLAHIAGQPVGAIFKIPHGDACTIFLAPSMRLNMDYVTKEYADIAKVLGVRAEGKSDKEAALEGIEILENLERDIHAPSRLSAYISKENFDVDMVLNNIQTSMGHIKTNPRPVCRELLKELLEMVW